MLWLVANGFSGFHRRLCISKIEFDMSRHAFLLDYKPAERPKYIEAFFSSIAWNVCEKRLKTGLAGGRVLPRLINLIADALPGRHPMVLAAS